jgi:purine-cytosine permease-like protein
MNIMVSGQIAAAFTSSDLSRYAKNHSSVWYGVMMGVTPVSAFMIALGALSRLASGEWNPVHGVQVLGMGVPALILIIFATWTTNDKAVYFGGLALTNIFPGRSRWLHTLTLGILGTTLGCFRLSRFFTEWLVVLGAIFAPLVAIVLVDYFLVRQRQPTLGDLHRKEGSYRYGRGINVAALAAIATGVVAGRVTPPELLQPVISMLITCIVYIAGMCWRYPEQFRAKVTS